MEYTAIRTSTIRPDTELFFDVYVYYKDTHLSYRQISQKIDNTIIEQMKSKKIKKLFIPSDQEPKYLKYLESALGTLQEKTQTIESRGEFAQDALKMEAENIGKTLESEEAYRSSEARIAQVVEFMLSEPKALASMLASAGLSVDDSQHGSTVTSLVLAVAAASKRTEKAELTDLAVSALLHDGSLKELGFDTKAIYADLPKDARPKFRAHPEKSAELVAGKKFITPRVLRIIQDHEEFGDGLGYPEKKRYPKLKIDSQIFNVCDAFDHFCIVAGKTAAECVEDFATQRGAHYGADLIEILKSQVKA
jgi:HD-GYP domain-containing protein (c-di-GMP phosphodiesterase class II)